MFTRKPATISQEDGGQPSVVAETLAGNAGQIKAYTAFLMNATPEVHREAQQVL